jgi:hypothetical protein
MWYFDIRALYASASIALWALDPALVSKEMTRQGRVRPAPPRLIWRRFQRLLPRPRYARVLRWQTHSGSSHRVIGVHLNALRERASADE